MQTRDRFELSVYCRLDVNAQIGLGEVKEKEKSKMALIWGLNNWEESEAIG